MRQSGEGLNEHLEVSFQAKDIFLRKGVAMKAMIEKEREIRRQRAVKEELVVQPKAAPKTPGRFPPVGAVFEVQGKSGVNYEVSLRHLDSPANHCTCPDFSTNSLGTCKHLEGVKLYLEKEAPDLFETMKKSAVESSFPPVNLVYLDHTISPPTVRFHMEEKSGKLEESCNKVFGKNNRLTLSKMKKEFPEFIDRSDELGFNVTPETMRFVDEVLQKAAMNKDAEKRAKEFDKKVIKAIKDEKDIKGAKVEEMEKGGGVPDYVLEGARFLLQVRRGLVLDDTGLDRAGQALRATKFILDSNPQESRKLIVFCNEFQIAKWRNMIAEHLVFTPFVFKASNGDESESRLSKAKFILAAYKDVPGLVSKLKISQNDILVLDNIHNFGNWQGSGGRSIKSIGCAHVFALSSPLLLENPKRLFYTVQYLDPYLLGPSWSFWDRHLVRDERGAIVDRINMDEMEKKIAGISVKRSFVDIEEELKEPLLLEIGVLPTTAQKKKINPALEALLKSLMTGMDWNPAQRATVVAQSARLRKLSNFLESDVSEQTSPKIKALLKLFRDIHGENGSFSFIVFTRFRDNAARTASILQEAGYPTSCITRTMSQEDRVKALEDFGEEILSGLVVADDILEGMEPINVNTVVELDIPWTPATTKQRDRVGTLIKKNGFQLRMRYYLTNSIEEIVKINVAQRANEIEELLPDPTMEMEGLPARGSEPLSRIVELLLDRDALKALLPSKAEERPAGKSGRPKQRQGGRQAAGGSSRKPKSGKKSPKSAKRVTTRGDVIVLGLTTRNQRPPGVTDESELRKLGLGVAVTYSYGSDNFTAWRQEYVNELIRTLMSAQLVVGWKTKGFDYKILTAYTGLPLNQVPTIDILTEVENALGYQIPAELITHATLEKRRRLMTDKAVAMWRNGRIRELAELVYEDVRLTRDIFSIVVRNRKIYYPKAPTGFPTPVELDLSSKIPEQAVSLIGKPPKRLGRRRM